MSTRFWLPISGAVPISPAPDGIWDYTGDMDYLPLLAAPLNTGTTQISATKTTAANPGDVLICSFVCPTALPNKTITGTFDMVMRNAENTATGNLFLQAVLKIVKPDNTLRGVLYSGQVQTAESANPADPNYEFSTNTGTLPSRILSGSVTSQVAVAGDYLCAEIGYRSCNVGTTRVGVLGLDDRTSETDMALAVDIALLTGACRPWIEFSADLFTPDPPDLVPTVIGFDGTTHIQQELSDTNLYDLFIAGQ